MFKELNNLVEPKLFEIRLKLPLRLLIIGSPQINMPTDLLSLLY